MTKRIPTNNYVTYFDPEKAHHRAWLQAVLDRLVSHEPDALQEGSDLRSLWKAAVETKSGTSWESITELARLAGAKYPELVAAQWALESGFGKHVSGCHNYFGLKGKGTVKSTNEEYSPGVTTTIKASFIDFDSPNECVQYLVDRWYKDFMSYKGVNNAPNRNAAARSLKDQGYATDSQYAAKLIRLMDEHAPPARKLTLPAQQGPKAPVKPGDHHLIANDITERMTAFDHAGNQLWEIPCLCRGQGSDREWRAKNSDTPPGLYKIGQIYNDFARVGSSPAFDRTLMSYGWLSFDMIDLEGQESKNGRAGIMLHGGGSGNGWPGAWAPMQPLLPTLGCIRCHNIDLKDRVLPLTQIGTVYITVVQES